MGLEGTDIAILSARLDTARLGASRLGFYPDDVEGAGTSEPGEYIWKEMFPPTTQWTLQTEGDICGHRPVGAFSMVGTSPPPPDTSTVSGTVTYDAVGGPFAWVGINVTMTVDGVPWPGGDAVTDGSGYYEFLTVPAGAIHVSVTGDPGPGQRDGFNDGVTVPPADLTLDIYAIGI